MGRKRKLTFRSAHTSGILAVLAIPMAVASSVRAQAPAAPVKVAQVVEKEILPDQAFVANVMPLRKSTVGSAVDGRIIGFMVNEGDQVVEGQPLAQLRTGTLEIELAAAKAQLSLRDSELKELENGLRPEEIEQARARMASAKARDEFARNKHERTERLYTERPGAVTVEELQDMEALAEQAAQAYQEAKAAHDLAVAGTRAEVIAQAKAQRDFAQEQVHLIEDRLEKHTIRAPFDGFVTTEYAEVGQWIMAAGPIVDVVEVHHVDVHAMVLEEYMENVHIGAPARVDITAIPGQTFRGEVSVIVPQGDLRSRNFPVKVRLENPLVDGTPLMMPGMFARVTLAVGKKMKATLVPKDAVVLGGASPVVYVVDRAASAQGPHKVRAVPVEIGVESEGYLQVANGLKPGDTVVIEGNERLRPMQEVTFPRQQGAESTKAGAATASSE